MAASKQGRMIRFHILICILIINFTCSAKADSSGVLARLLKKTDKNRPVVLVLGNSGRNDKVISREDRHDHSNHEKSVPYEYLKKILQEDSYELHHSNSRDHKHDDRPRSYDRKYRHRYRYDDNDRREKNRGARYRLNYNENREDRNRIKRYRDRRDEYQQDDRGDWSRNRDRENRYRQTNRYTYYRERPRLRTQDQEQDKRVQDQDKRDQDRRNQDQDRKDQDRRDQNQDRKEQDRRDQDQDRRDEDRRDQDRRDQDRRGQDRRDQDQDRRDRDQDRSDPPSGGSASAQIPIVKSLLRSLNCNARDECQDTCDRYPPRRKDDCEDQCEQRYECEADEDYEDPCDDCNENPDCGRPQCTGSTKGETLVTEEPGCKRC